MKIRCIMSTLLILVGITTLPMLTRAQSVADSGDSSSMVASTPAAQLDLTYTRPTQITKFRNYIFDGFGPYPIVGAAVVAGMEQAENAPPEWNQGAKG